MIAIYCSVTAEHKVINCYDAIDYKNQSKHIPLKWQVPLRRDDVRPVAASVGSSLAIKQV